MMEVSPYLCVLLLTVAVYCSSLSKAEPEAASLIVNPSETNAKSSGPPTVQTLECTPFVKHSDGSNYNLTLSQYLENGKYLKCVPSVNTELKEIFKNTPESAKFRQELSGSLGNVCALYVEVLSLLARNKQSSIMCDEGALGDEALKERDFCSSVQPTDPLVISTADALDVFEFSNYSSALTSLLGLGDGVCIAKCGEGKGRILCNAYFSMATVLSKVWYQVMQSKIDEVRVAASKLPAATPLIPSPTDTPPPDVPSANPQTFPLPTNEEISRLIGSLGLVSTQELLLLAVGNSGYRQEALEQILEAVPPKELEAFLARPDVATILRMFWVARLVYDKFSKMEPDDLNYSTRYDNLLFWGHIESSDMILMDNFVDKDTVLSYIHKYRTLLFAGGNSVSKEPVEVLRPETEEVIEEVVGAVVPTGIGVAEKDGNGDRDNVGGGVLPILESGDKTPTGSQDPDFLSLLESKIPRPQDQILAELAQLAHDPSLVKLSQFLDDKTLDPQDEIDARDLLERIGSILQVGDTDELRIALKNTTVRTVLGLQDDIPVPSKVEVVKDTNPPTTASGGDGELGDAEGANKNKKAPDIGNLDASGEEEQPPSRGYGPFHFLGLFIIIAAVAVVGYLCMHNRKKLREGVNGYISGSGKRRRTRNYKPLATSEA